MIDRQPPPRRTIGAIMGGMLDCMSSSVEALSCGLKAVWVDVPDARLSVYLNGKFDKPALILLHGLTGSKRVWTRFVRRLVRDYCVVIPDLPGHGQTRFNRSIDYGVPAHCDRVIALLDHLGIQRAHWVGSSMGGYIGARAAAAHPDRVATLALFAPAGVPSSEHSQMDRLVLQGRNPFLVSSEDDYAAFYKLIMSSPPYTPSIVMSHFFWRYKSTREEIEYMFDAYRSSPPLTGFLGEIAAPTLVIWGREDKILHPSGIEAWRTGVRNITTETWPGVGHMPVLEFPRQTSRRLQSFLASQTT